MNDTVVLHDSQPGIAIVELSDKVHRNTFSPKLIEGLTHVFNQIAENIDIKVVLIHGYDNYFCCGGTKEELLDIHAEKITFADLSFYRLLLDCEVPTIAAVQGHAIGGGLVFACYADMMILAEESIYSANFMKYGFTPGMGATYMIPKKFGINLGWELLYSADTYYGRTLRKKGCPLEIVKRHEVISQALLLAKQLAEKPRYALKLLKAQLTQEIRHQLPTIIEHELAMHKETFHLPDVRQRIATLFGK